MIYGEMVYHYIVSEFWAQMFNKTSLVEKMGVYWMTCLISYLWLAVMIACGLVVCG